MSFVRKTTPPPECQEGDILRAKLLEVKKIQSQWKDDEGNLREQLEINFELENGYKGKTWMAYYEQPGDKSALGKLALKLQQVTKHEINDINGFLTAFKSYGLMFVKVKGFREYDGEEFPNFSIVTDKVPSKPATQEKLPSDGEEKKPDLKFLEPFKEAITLGLPLNQNDLPLNNRVTLVKNGLVTEKDGLLFFTDKARENCKNEM